MKTCSSCMSSLDGYLFYRDKTKKDGLSSSCKDCSQKRAKAWAEANPDRRRDHKNKWSESNPEKDRQAKRDWNKRNPEAKLADTRRRQATQVSQIPTWYDKESVETLYQKAREFGFHVDHVVPLRGETVCGLHVQDNLQLLHPSENCSKQNKHWPDMW